MTILALPMAAAAGPLLVEARSSHPDTIYLMGGPGMTDGDFQNDLDPSVPDAEGWMSANEFDPLKWHIDTVNADNLDPGNPGNHAMWCGGYYPPCFLEGEEASPGYGNSWDEWLVWKGPVPDPSLPTEINLIAVLNHDTEPGYDYLYLDVRDAEGYTQLDSFDGNNNDPVNVHQIFTLEPGDYQGDAGDEIHLRWRFRSDGGRSDADCTWPSLGASQVDNIVVIFDQGQGAILQTFDDFEPGSPVHWSAMRPDDCGYAKVWPLLEEADVSECGQVPNTTPRLAFIDDGTQCDGGPTFGTDITYGPGGMAVDYEGMEAWGDRRYQFWSPVLEIPESHIYDTIEVSFDVYLHQEANYCTFVEVGRRGSEDGGATWNQWRLARSYEIQASQPTTRRATVRFPNQESNNRVQISLETKKTYDTCEGNSPAPYIDNVRVVAYRHQGPLLGNTYAQGDRFTANWPNNGAVDFEDLATNDVPLGYIEVDVARPRHGAELAGPPELHWTLKANPLFDPYRLNVPSNPVVGVRESDGSLRHPDDRYRFTLPNEGFVFPGDEFRFFIRAQDDVDGDIGTTIMPADTTGFSTFEESLTGLADPYDQNFRIRALPTVRAAHPDSLPKILVWDGTDDREEIESLMASLAPLGFRPGRDYDIQCYGAPGADYSSRALDAYTSIIGSQGRLYSHSLGLDRWAGLGGRNLLLMGNDIGTGGRSGYTPATMELIGSVADGGDVSSFIDDQVAPALIPTALVPGIDVTMAADGCGYPGFDAMAPHGAGRVLYRFGSPGGGAGSYSHHPAIFHYIPEDDAAVISLPITFTRLTSPVGYAGVHPAPTIFLGQVLDFFAGRGSGAPAPVPGLEAFHVQVHPNPFNPRTTISFNLPRKEMVDLSVYDLAGRRVKTLLSSEVLPGGPHEAVWTGRDDADRLVGAGVYLYRLKAGPHVAVQRVTLIK